MTNTNSTEKCSISAVRTERIKEVIANMAIRTSEAGARLISRTGGSQNWLIDLRPIFMQRDVMVAIAAEFWDSHRQSVKFQICGMEAAGIPLLTALLLCAPAEMGNVNGFIIRKERKTTGLGNAIEGHVTDDPIVFVDDIVNSGSSVEKARAVIHAIGKSIDTVFAVVDYRSRKGMQWRTQRKVGVASLFTLDDFGLKLSKNPDLPPQQYKQLWHTPVLGGYPFYVVPKSAPVLLNGYIFRGSDAGKMQAFDAQNGSLFWEFQATGATSRKGIWSTPALHDERLYFGAYNGCIYCLDARTGAEIWSQSYGEWVGASPIIVSHHGLVYFGIEYERPWAQGSIGALDMATGQKVWERRTNAFQHGSPAYWKGGDLIVWGSADHDMLGMDARTGAVRWIFKTRRSVKYAPAIDEARGLVAFASFDKSIYVLDLATGQKRGEWETGDICYTTPLFFGNRLFCGSGDRHLYVIDIETMQLVKKIDLHARIYSSPVPVDGRIIFGTGGGRIIELDPITLDIKGDLQVPDAVTNAVAVSEDGSHIYVSTYMNHLFAFERVKDDYVRSSSSGNDASVVMSQVSNEPLRHFRKLAERVDIAAIRGELEAQPEAWLVNTSRQDRIAVQRDTESIFLRAAARPPGSPLATEDVHPSRFTELASRFPITMAWLERFSGDANRSLARVLVAKLKPNAQVFRHVDGGEYYKMRDRYHLVLRSSCGSPMTCGEETVVMAEGELWWFDNKQPHEAFNRSQDERIHLIFDLDPT